MKINCLLENVEKHLTVLNKIIPTHTQIPIFSHILIEANPHGLFLSATDLELGVRLKIPAKIEEEGIAAVPGKQFIEVVSSLPKGKIMFFTEKDMFIITAGESKISFQTIPAEEFPKLFDKKKEKKITFNKEEFKGIFSKLVFSVSQDESRPVLTGIQILQKNKETEFVATDGYRLSIKKINKNLLQKEGEKIILSARCIGEVFSLKTEDQDIVMSVFSEGNQVFFETEDAVLMGRLIDGVYPVYEAIIPTSFKTKAIVNKEEFLQSVRLASVFARDSAYIVKLKITDGVLRVFSKAAGVGEGEINTDVEQDGEDNEVVFNTKFLLDLLKNIESEQVVIEMNSAIEPVVFRDQKDDSFFHIIMPVRVEV